jgi:flagellar hook-basal body complex protein FliE
MGIDPIMKNLCEGAPGATMSKMSGETAPVSFAEELKSKVSEVNRLQNQAATNMEQATIKGATNIHETMIQLAQADMGLSLLAKVRNKALDAYHEVMRMSF